MEIIASIFADYKGLKLEISLKEKNQKQSNSLRLNNKLLTMNGVTMKAKKKSKSFWKQMKMNSQ